ncbi:MAG TPA: CAP domain-containing protein, partial [Gemmatimonadales bacterium]|nr:CAP domain-containing protein [Gemmatimonadales bacterium]
IACAPGGPYYTPMSTGAKLGEALAFATAAAAVQAAQAVAEQNARNSAPVTHTGGVGISPNCDNQGQYGCVSVAAWPAPGSHTQPAAPSPEMSDEEAREYVLGYINGVRRLNGVQRLVRDEPLDAFAKAGSDELALTHRPNRHMADHARELPAGSVEVQGPTEGSPAGPLQDQIAAILLRFTAEGAGGVHHDAILRAEWRKLGVGIGRSDGRMYFTVDFST